ncbi:DUF2268 domain-containing putative Zn-dependent protease [Jeotgalibacillus haloalkalitolerans]|uniref:DUF2268 domain-containing putative Zn-dependent protease n=1 Tax=Jeotgalibacillus haloalkalitolerans TaxID=3104292 RepID=A0ABU5KHK9_9BACL|nr:DUF2268 domain-containing putative Zn-dependent protease [Jeotgalibacillus sp. HH7-29]MDZ5710706.1 DUF2268 domain-containing putative Zn-dependent protease [Jeotgalibacillus sp. HH7-29]
MNQIEVLNLVPKFLNFYDKANQPDINADERFKLWKEHYNFAAIPPGEEGQKMAREMLDHAFTQYAKHVPVLKEWNPDTSKLERTLIDIKDIMGYHQPVNLTVIYFVGGFENNPFVAPYGEGKAVCLPIECGESDIFLAHELTHIIHGETAGIKPSWERTIGSTLLQEGLATRISEYYVPGEPEEKYIANQDGWLEACKERHADILEGIIPFLDDQSAETVSRFIFGTGTAGLPREVYYAGWETVGKLLEEGVTFEKMAYIPEEDIPEYIRKAMVKETLR